MTPVTLLSLGLTAQPSLTEPARTVLVESAEWLCTRSDAVVFGTITAARDLQGSGKNRGLMYMRVDGEELRPHARSGTFSIGIRNVSLTDLNSLSAQGVPLVLFLRKTNQAFSFDGGAVDLWPLRTEAPGHWVYPLSAESPLISARGTLVPDAAALRELCSALPQVDTYPEPPHAYLPTPPDVKTVLKDRTPSYLKVPAAQFPEAQPTPPAPSLPQ